MSSKRITGSSTNSSNGSATASTNSLQESPQRIDVDYVTQCIYYSTGEGEVSGEVTVNDANSPGGKRKAFVHSIVAWDMRGKKCVFEAWSKYAKNARIFFEYVVSLFNRCITSYGLLANRYNFFLIVPTIVRAALYSCCQHYRNQCCNMFQESPIATRSRRMWQRDSSSKSL
jgi:hypothetical protein